MEIPKAPEEHSFTVSLSSNLKNFTQDLQILLKLKKHKKNYANDTGITIAYDKEHISTIQGFLA